MIQRAEYLNWLIKLKDKQIIKVITGIRRCGKSTLFAIYKKYLVSNNVEENQIIDINFEDNNYRNLLDEQKLHDYIISNCVENKMNYIFLDEIQNVPNFEKCVNSLHLNENLDIYITGSNSYMLSGELATYLTGRYMQIHMLPLSFKEYFDWYEKNSKLIYPDTIEEIKPNDNNFIHEIKAVKSKEEIYNDYTLNGGFPYLINLDNDQTLITNYLDSVYNTVLMKDIISRKQINDVLMLDSVVRFLFANIGSLVSINKISDTLNSNGRKNSVNTIESYVNALLESFILYKVNRYDIKGKQHLKTLEKYYLCDLGLRNYLIGNRENTDLGFILENVIFLELKRKGYKIYVGKNDDTEVDFVIKNENETKYIQVALSVREKSTLDRELSPLNSIKDHHSKYLITLDYDTNNHNGIKQINALDFLLGKIEL